MALDLYTVAANLAGELSRMTGGTRAWDAQACMVGARHAARMASWHSQDGTLQAILDRVPYPRGIHGPVERLHADAEAWEVAWPRVRRWLASRGAPVAEWRPRG